VGPKEKKGFEKMCKELGKEPENWRKNIKEEGREGEFFKPLHSENTIEENEKKE